MVFAKCIPGFFFFYERLQVNTYIKDEKLEKTDIPSLNGFC